MGRFPYGMQDYSAFINTWKKEKVEDLDVTELFEAPEIEAVVTKIEKLGLDLENYYPESLPRQQKEAKGKEAEKKLKALYRITNEKDVKDLNDPQAPQDQI